MEKMIDKINDKVLKVNDLGALIMEAKLLLNNSAETELSKRLKNTIKYAIKKDLKSIIDLIDSI